MVTLTQQDIDFAFISMDVYFDKNTGDTIGAWTDISSSRDFVSDWHSTIAVDTLTGGNKDDIFIGGDAGR